MPSLSLADRAAKCTMPVATSAAHPRAAVTSVSNWVAISSAERRDDPAADAGLAIDRIRWPSGTNGTSTRARSRANSSSGGAHTRSAAPSVRSRTARPASGSTSPRDP
ncbi:hypothetical protein [Actinophytocola xanthii]|uniref:Uncharacterized protein n=1 Tax=Actinophytocola xanthii TaxID=1912961 RepID=A0A1Q8CT24_9PSEU|nr:hypothetical protein [Actinophytocola xanthii]OLF17500.1 hypothetical protein BU204_11210 [Actinophytocola xanthii]